MQHIPVRKNKTPISKRFSLSVVMLVLFLSCGIAVAAENSLLTVANENPSYPVAASISVAEGVSPLTVVFSIEEVENGHMFPGLYVWNFGDGAQGEGREAQHTYEYGGLFAPFVKVRFANGHDEILPLPRISVLNGEGMVGTPTSAPTSIPTETPTPIPTPEPTPVPTPAPTPELVEVEAAFVEANSVEAELAEVEPVEAESVEAEPAEIESVEAEPVEVDTPTPTPAPTQTPTQAPTSAPVPAITPVQTTESVSADLPIVRIVADKEVGPVPLRVRFTTETENGLPLVWKWDFGDGDKSTVRKPAHNYGTPGTYVVQASVQFLGPIWVDAEPITIVVG